MLNLLPMITNGFISTDALTASAQTYGNESYYECDDDEIGVFTSPIPCDGVEIESHRCEKCDEHFATEDDLKQHMRDCHTVYECQYCHAQFYELPDDYQNQKARDKHEETCPYRSANKDDNSGEQNQGTDPAVNVGGSSGGSGSHSHGDNSENKNTWSGLSKAITKLNSNALSLEDYKKKGKGECAKYVRIAIQAGGIDTSDHPIYAKNYGPYLIRWGFKEIPCTDYIPKTGDIRVWQNYPGGNIAGHIDMFNGTGWVSDFFEPNPSGPNSKYRKYKKFKIYRK